MRVCWLIGVVNAALLAGCTGQPTGPAKTASDGDGPSLTADFRAVVKGATEKVFPAVVFIKCVTESHESGRKLAHEVVGSGVLISDCGEMLTNWHVVDKAKDIRCLLYDGRHYDATVVGTDKDLDVALLRLKLEPGQKVPYAHLGDSSALREGDFVMAMGAPWGMSRSVSIGIIACTRRFLPGHSEYSLWLQTDASISPGNSGGPLVDTAGRVIGLTTRGVSYGGDMGFAIPSATIKHLVASLRESGKIDWTWTGLQLQPLRDFNRNIYFDGAEGVIVSETDPESPARHCGLQPRDRILAVNGSKVAALTDEDLPDVRTLLGLLARDKPTNLTVMRDGQTRTVELTPREKGKVEGDELDCPRWDMTVKTINQFDNPDLFFHSAKGVFIYGVKYPGNASSSGLRESDIILRIGDQEVQTLEQVKAIHAEAIKNVEHERRALLTVLRNGLLTQVVLDFARDYQKE